ncbi:MAG TPA: glycosyltransferase family 2 protein [Chloroflexota bacterium]|nr:glycosyltransferase family 2 protein [Chloroflexota bacterium]
MRSVSSPGDLRLSIVIPTFNGQKHLAVCLPTVFDQGRPPNEVVVVDDCSTDATSALFGDQFPAVRVVRLARNQGFVAAANAGLRTATGDLIFLLNDDTLLEPGCLEAMIVAATTSGAGMVAPTMTFMSHPNIVNGAGIALDRAGIAWDLAGGQPVSGLGHMQPFGPSGGAALYHRALLDDVGLFDEDFGAYLEDLDLAWRARLAGWHCVHAPGARVRHVHSATAGANSPRKRFLLARNKIWTIAKNYPSPEVWHFLPAIVGFDLLAAVSFVVASPRATVTINSRIAAVRGRLAGLVGLPGALRKRRQVQSRRRVAGTDLLALMVGVETPARVRSRFQHLPEVAGPSPRSRLESD